MTESTANQWFESAPDPQRAILEELRALVLEIGPGIEESIKWGRPCYSTTRGLFCYLHRTKNHVTLGFQKGAMLEDPAELLEGTGKDLRHIKVTSRDKIDQRQFSLLLKQAYTL